MGIRFILLSYWLTVLCPLSRWRITSAVSVYSSAALCVLMAVAGYLGQFDQSRGNILNSFPLGSFALAFRLSPAPQLLTSVETGDPVIIAARLAFALTMFFTFPLEAFVVRHVVEQLWSYWNTQRGRPAPTFWWPRHIIITTCIVLAALGIAVGVGDNLGLVLELVGRLLPGRIWSLPKIPALAMCVFGIANGITSTILILIGFATR
jgi:sodium-coupled neutral amino acid transporter 11